MSPGGQQLSQYRFRHILFQKYLYNSLDDAECTYLHEAVGQVLADFVRVAIDEVHHVALFRQPISLPITPARLRHSAARSFASFSPGALAW